jgi:uncharacterized protein
MYTKEEILEYLKGKKQHFLDDYSIGKVGIFGSYARGTQSESSDLDILFEFREVSGSIYDIKELIRKELKRDLGLNIDICREKAINQLFRDIIMSDAIYA